MIQRTKLIYNPSSGREQMRRALPDILQRLEDAGFETSVIATQGPGDARKATQKAIERDFECVIVAGGDGTVNEVVNGLIPAPHKPILGVLPLGTTNDIARALGMPRAWKQALDVIAQRQVCHMDMGQMNDIAFANVVGGGALTELSYEAPSKLKTLIGQLAYYIKGIEKLPTLHPTRMIVHTPRQTIDEQLMLFLVANTNSIGGYSTLLPQARWDDGTLDVLCLRKCNFAEFIRLVSLIVRGERIDHDPLCIHLRTPTLTISSPDRVLLNIDGEFGGELPCTIGILPRMLPVYVCPDRMHLVHVPNLRSARAKKRILEAIEGESNDEQQE
ncbi:MAG: YegS/Rv2252/BmrU family lipid kinase [Paenibacillaceae bacterium]|nr:YegS/Rv2252/BmrU family lipid kinase [Paenibacillaceae bacterium]